MAEIWDHLHRIRHLRTRNMPPNAKGERFPVALCAMPLREADGRVNYCTGSNEYCGLPHDLPDCPSCEYRATEDDDGV